MKQSSCVLFSLILLLLHLSYPGAALPGNNPADPLSGPNVFVSKKCSACHLLQQGKSGVGMDLFRTQYGDSILDISALIWNHGPAIRPQMERMGIDFPPMTAAEMGSLISFITAYQYEVNQPKADPARGEIVWNGKKCSGCHALTAGTQQRSASNLMAFKDFSVAQFIAPMSNSGTAMYAEMQEHGIMLQSVTGQDIRDLLAFIRLKNGMPPSAPAAMDLGNPNRGAEVFADKQCDSCHSVFGKGGTTASELSNHKSITDITALLWKHVSTMRTEMSKKGQQGGLSFNQGEVADLLAYLYLIKYSDALGDAKAGRKLFETKGCVSCHKDESPVPGNTVAKPDLNACLQHAATMWNHMARRLSGKDQAVIQPGEMRHLVAYLSVRKATK